jgi:hypothetical protein
MLFTQKYVKYVIVMNYIPQNIEQLQINPYNFLFLHEPDDFFGMASHAIKVKDYFTAILSWDQKLLDVCVNGIKFTYNGCTLDSDYINEVDTREKQFQISFLCGTKTLVEGHLLRHKVYKLDENITIPKKWYYVLEDYDSETNTRPGYTEYSKDLSHIPTGVDPISYGRRVLFNNSMFNVVIENVKYNNWYNKIGDNFATKTIPIYWGCPNISEFGYDERGIIRFQTTDELLDIINNLTPETYQQMLPYVEYNYELVKQDTFENNISQFFDSFIELNSL